MDKKNQDYWVNNLFKNNYNRYYDINEKKVLDETLSDSENEDLLDETLLDNDKRYLLDETLLDEE